MKRVLYWAGIVAGVNAVFFMGSTKNEGIVLALVALASLKASELSP